MSATDERSEQSRPVPAAGDPKVLIVLRTHIWDEAVALVFSRLTASRHEVVIAADNMNGFVPPVGSHEVLLHRLDTFEALGLPLFPAPEKTLWYNGDYILYDVAARKSFDYVVLVENDTVVVGDIDNLIDRLLSENVSYAVKNYGVRGRNYMWREQVCDWMAAEGWSGPYYGGLFPLVFASRAVVDGLLHARLAMARKLAGKPEAWLHCEPFAATWVSRQEVEARPLRHFADVRRCTVRWPIRPAEIEDISGPRLALLHPVLAEPAYSRKLITSLGEVLEEERAQARRTSRRAGHLADQLQALTRERDELAARADAFHRMLLTARGGLGRRDERIAKLQAKIEWLENANRQLTASMRRFRFLRRLAPGSWLGRARPGGKRLAEPDCVDGAKPGDAGPTLWRADGA